MNKTIQQTTYRLERFDNSSWLRVMKDSKQEALVANSEAGLQFVWREIGKPIDRFCVCDNMGNVAVVDRGSL